MRENLDQCEEQSQEDSFHGIVTYLRVVGWPELIALWALAGVIGALVLIGGAALLLVKPTSS